MAAGTPADQLDRELGLRRARASALFELALPGSCYLRQGEELGLHEVTEITAEQRQDPAFFRGDPENVRWDGIGRYGCRVPIPWTADGPSFGFGSGAPHLPQPEWFASVCVEGQEKEPDSTLTIFRRALRLRHELKPEDEGLTWEQSLSNDDVLAFSRSGGWLTVTNFSSNLIPMPDGKLLVTSTSVSDPRVLPADTTAWIRQ